MRQEFGEEGLGRWRPRSMMVAARRLGLERPAVLQPLMAQLVEPGRGEVEPLGGGSGIELAIVKGRQDFLDVEWWDAVG